MSIAPPSSPKPDSSTLSTEPQPDSQGVTRLLDSPWRPVISCGGALGLGLLLASFSIKPVAQNGDGDGTPEIILPRETTMIVAPSMPPGQLLRGQIRLVADVIGKAPVGGAVARQLVEPGARVKQGDRVMEISSGGSERPAPAAESLQQEAEKSQIAASDAQSALAQKINIAQSKLRAAQDRVEKAQDQVAKARDIVRRLQNGEAVSSSEIPAGFRPDAPATPKKRSLAKQTPQVDRAGEIALQQAEAAREAAAQGANGLKTARQMLAEAQKSAREASQRLENSTKKVAEVEAHFDEKKASGADVEEARADQRDAKNVVAATERAVVSAKAEVAKREKAATALQKYADKAAADAKAALKNARLFPQEEGKEAEEEAPAAAGSQIVTLEQAIKFVGATLEESRRATLDAERLNNEIAGYKHQVSTSSARIESTTEQLAAAQQRVLDSVPRAKFTAALAPADGIVTWVSRLAREVNAGDAIFGIARGSKVGARFEDKSGLWRGLKVGASLPAVTVPPVAGTTGAAPITEGGTGTPVDIVVTAVNSPEGPEQPAVVEGEVRTPAAKPTIGEGMQLVASVAAPNAKPSITVPVTAVVPSEHGSFVAVLSPAPENQPVEKQQMAQGGEVSELKKPDEGGFRLQWKQVQLGRSDGFRSEVLSGLKSGERIITSLDRLQELGFSPEPEAVQGVRERGLPQEVSSPDILVRLTSVSPQEQTT